MNQQMMGRAPAWQAWLKKLAYIAVWTIVTVAVAWAAPYLIVAVIAALAVGDIESFRTLVTGMATADAHGWQSFAETASMMAVIIRTFIVLLSIYLLTGRKASAGSDRLLKSAGTGVARLPLLSRFLAMDVDIWVPLMWVAGVVIFVLIGMTYREKVTSPPIVPKLTQPLPETAAAISLQDGRILSGAADVHEDSQGHFVVSFSAPGNQPRVGH